MGWHTGIDPAGDAVTARLVHLLHHATIVSEPRLELGLTAPEAVVLPLNTIRWCTDVESNDVGRTFKPVQ
jgi:hypothetical protein